MKQILFILLIALLIFSFFYSYIPLINENTFSVFNYNDDVINYYIFVNLDENLLYLYIDDKFINSFPISGGKTSTPSPEGSWEIITKERWGKGFGGYWLGLNVPWGKYGIHGNNSAFDIGKKNISAGCIRMHNEDIKELYNTIPHGTVVDIIHLDKPFRVLKAGCVGSDVLELQNKLKTLGFFDYYCDGKFGEITKKAVINFQRAYELPVTGKVNEEMLAKIIEVSFN